jgi:hypothetical protein
MSIIANRIEELKRKFLTVTEYVDLYFRGIYVDPSSGEPLIAVSRDKALENSVKIWMLSRKGDYYREPFKGGVLDLLLGTPLDESRSEEIKSAITSKFQEDFSLVELKDLFIEIDYEVRVWKVGYSILDILNKRLVEFNINVQV